MAKTTDSVYRLVPQAGADGPSGLCAVVKRTYSFGTGQCSVARRQRPLADADMYENVDSPETSDIVCECELGPAKQATDVVVLGNACAPRLKRAYRLDCSVCVGPVEKTVSVFGRRYIRPGRFGSVRLTPPEPFEEQPLGYRYAYGGIAVLRDGTVRSFPPNPIGRGFLLREHRGSGQALVAPHIEDPLLPLTGNSLVVPRYERWSSGPIPASLGWTRRNSHPRYALAGLPPAHQATAPAQASPVPVLNSSYYQGASPGLWAGFLRGDEAVRVTHMDARNPSMEFCLPGERPCMAVRTPHAVSAPTVTLDTVMLDMPTRELSLVWKGTVSVGAWHDVALANLEVSWEKVP